MSLFSFLFVWDCVADDGKVVRVKSPESVGLIIELSERRNQGLVVVGCGLFEIMLPLPLI